MKKSTILLLSGLVLMGCDNIEVIEPVNEMNLPETEVFIQGKMSYTGTKGYAWPYVNEDEGWESARFSIRIDESFPGYTNQSSDLYFGRKPNQKPSGLNDKNRGEVWTNYPYGHYNDRNFDYYKQDKATGNNIGMFRYVYDDKGLKTKLAIKWAPSVEDILTDEFDDLTAAINKGQNVAANTEKLEIVKDLLDLGRDYLDSHVLWYVVKEVGGQGLWHVNGVLRETEPGEPDNTPDDVEIDIHQQNHVNWSEIKTSIHIRADVQSLTLNIPLAIDDIVEQDDFDIRIFQQFISSDNSDFTGAKVTILHNENGITIQITDIDYEAIKGYKESFGDGLTIEIFSYTTSSDVWSKVKKSKVVSIGKTCTVKGQITSAYNEEKVYIYAPN